MVDSIKPELSRPLRQIEIVFGPTAGHRGAFESCLDPGPETAEGRPHRGLPLYEAAGIGVMFVLNESGARVRLRFDHDLRGGHR